MTLAEFETILLLAKLKVEARREVERRAKESNPARTRTGQSRATAPAESGQRQVARLTGALPLASSPPRKDAEPFEFFASGALRAQDDAHRPHLEAWTPPARVLRVVRSAACGGPPG